VPQQAERGRRAARACGQAEAARLGVEDPRRAREGSAAHNYHKEEEKAQGRGPERAYIAFATNMPSAGPDELYPHR